MLELDNQAEVNCWTIW